MKDIPAGINPTYRVTAEYDLHVKYSNLWEALKSARQRKGKVFYLPLTNKAITLHDGHFVTDGENEDPIPVGKYPLMTLMDLDKE
jgi:hypothetical protein